MRTIRTAGHGVVEVWRLRISTAPVAELSQCLSEAERERAARFVQARDRDRFIAVRGWLRRLQGTYLDLPPAAVTFETGPRGKPALSGQVGASALRFNVSHSGDMGIAAFCRGREVGVDVEQIRDDFDVVNLGRTSFSPEEQDDLHACAPDARVERFFQLWTAKEAYIKALGDGLSIPLREFTVRMAADGGHWTVATVASTGSSAVRVIYPLTAPSGYAAAVAASGTGWRVSEREAIL